MGNEYAVMPTSKDETIAWVLWHIARVEDLTMNILAAWDKQVFYQEWKGRMKAGTALLQKRRCREDTGHCPQFKCS